MLARIVYLSVVSSSVAYLSRHDSCSLRSLTVRRAEESITTGEAALPAVNTEYTPMPVEEYKPPARKQATKERLDAKWIPFGVKAPVTLDGTLAGDVGFDPLGFAKSTKTLYWMREAETKHGRLAMLAAAGWPLSELWHKVI